MFAAYAFQSRNQKLKLRNIEPYRKAKPQNVNEENFQMVGMEGAYLSSSLNPPLHVNEVTWKDHH
jgi:hypothetical protein